MPTVRRVPWFPFLAAMWLLLSPCHPVTLSPCHALDPVIDAPMYASPALPTPPVVKVFPEGALRLWLRALERPEADLRCQAADAIAQAHRRGMKGLEGAVAPLVAALDRADQDPAVRLAVAHALIALEARQAAASLLQAAAVGLCRSEFRALVEPALARWGHRPAGDWWPGRLPQPATPPPGPGGNLPPATRGLPPVRAGSAPAPPPGLWRA